MVTGLPRRATGPHIMKQAAASGQSVSDTLSQAGLGALTRAMTVVIVVPFTFFWVIWGSLIKRTQPQKQGALLRMWLLGYSGSMTVPELMAGPQTAHRMGPHWPPPGPERPDPLKTRQQLMQMGPHRTFVELHAKDRKAPEEYLYTVTRT